MESSDEGLELLLDTFLDTPFRDESSTVSGSSTEKQTINLLNVFVLVLICDLDIVAPGLQLDAHSLAKPFVVCRKRQLERVGDIVVPTSD